MLLLCGASGLLGRKLYDYFENGKIPFIGTHNSNRYKNSVYINFLDINEVDNFFIQNKINVCVNTIAKRYVDVCEKNWQLTYQTNVQIPNILAKICSKYRVLLIHISTDYVFDGMNHQGNYPQSLVNPLQNYGITKLLAEQRIQSNHNYWSIIRVPVLYSDEQTGLDESSVTVIGKKVLDRTKVHKEDNYFIRRPLFIDDLIPFIIDCINRPILGIRHFYNPDVKLTKYIIGKTIAQVLHKPLNIQNIEDPPNDNADRPYDTMLLDNTYNIRNYQFTDFTDSIIKCYKHLIHNPDLSNCFLLIDLDGTLIDSDILHYEAYKRVLEPYNIDLDWIIFDLIINTIGMEEFIKQQNLDYTSIKLEKGKLILDTKNLQVKKGSEELIEYLNRNNINYAVVTNTNRKTVEHFKTLCPLLNTIQQWIVREDYTHSKPDRECYDLAIQRFHKGESKIIGVENTLTGIKALNNITQCIYLVADPNTYAYKHNKNDLYIIDNLANICM